MITFTKEQLIASAHARIEFAEMMLAGELEPLKERTWSIELELARIALASLEAGPVAITDYMAYAFHNALSDSSLGADEVEEIKDGLRAAFANVTAPPAPANAEPVAWLWSHRKHPSEVSLIRPEDDERAEGAHWSGWSCQALYAAPPVPVSVPDEDLLHMAASAIEDLLSNKDRYCAGVWADIPAKLRRAAMLQGAEQQNRQQNIPENIPTLRDGLAAIRNSGIAIDAEKIFAERDALNAPDCWCRTCRPITMADMRFVVCPECGNKRCPHANDHRHACTGSNEPGQEGSAYPAAPKQEVKP